MKSFKTYISEAVATRKKPTRAEKTEFADKFDQVVYSKPFTDLQDKRYLHKWHITGHNPGAKHGTNKAIEAVKEKVFGKRRKGTSDLLWMHHKHGLITHPAIGDVTHGDVQDHLGYGQRKGIRVNKKIKAKVKEGGLGAIIGQGRIEHHEGGGGLISYHHAGGMPKEAAIRTIARAYPKYKIHDGHGNLLENWSEKYKRSIDCSNPKGFSQRAHCQGRKKTNENVEVMSFMRYLNEAKEETITDFVRFASQELGLQNEPNIEFVDVRDGDMTTAAYCPSDCSMKIYRGNRATFDICRSIAHEMVHQMQDENGDVLDGRTGSPCEDEANAIAGRMIRMYGERNPDFYE